MRIKALLIFLLLAEPVFATCSSKIIITANMTDMREELKRYKKKGWKTVGRIHFKEYSFQQRIQKCG